MTPAMGTIVSNAVLGGFEWQRPLDDGHDKRPGRESIRERSLIGRPGTELRCVFGSYSASSPSRPRSSAYRMPGMKTAVAIFIFLFGAMWCFVDTVPGTTPLPFHESWLGLLIIALGLWMLNRRQRAKQP